LGLFVDDGPFDMPPSEDELSGAPIMCLAEQAEVLDAGGSAERARKAMILLEPGA
jgi:hypothetical protein